MNEKESFFFPAESDPSGRYEEKQESLLTKLNRAARPMMLAVVLGISTFGAPSGAEAAPETHTIESPELRQELIANLETALGKSTVVSIRLLESVHDSEEKQKLLDAPHEFVSENAEKLGVTAEELSVFMAELPPSLSYNVRKVSYEKDIPVPEKYGMDTKKHVVGGMSLGGGHIAITEHGMSEGFETMITHTLLHEFAHHADWKRNVLLEVDERLILCSRVLERVLSPDRYQSAYVEAIRNEDSKKELALKVAEYWAVIAAAACTPEAATMNHKDLELVEDFFKKVSPSISMDEVRAKVAVFISKHKDTVSVPELPQSEKMVESEKKEEVVESPEQEAGRPTEIANDEDQPLEPPDLPNDD